MTRETVIVAIIGTHARWDNVRQIELALARQSVSPARIVVVCTSGIGDRRDLKYSDLINLSWNAGVWFRFHVCWQFPEATHYAIFDDDTIPGEVWFENCLTTLEATGGGIAGASGVVFLRGGRDPREYYGAAAKSPYITPVDIVGHCWFFSRDILEFAYGDFYRLAKVNGCSPQRFALAGEDYWISAAARQKWLCDESTRRTRVPETLWGGVYVPPHRYEVKDEWGSLKPELGAKQGALYLIPESEQWKEIVHEEMKRMGWRTIYEYTNSVRAANQIRP